MVSVMETRIFVRYVDPSGQHQCNTMHAYQVDNGLSIAIDIVIDIDISIDIYLEVIYYLLF